MREVRCNDIKRDATAAALGYWFNTLVKVVTYVKRACLREVCIKVG